MSVFSGTRGAFRTGPASTVGVRPAPGDKSNAVVISMDELQRIKQSCALNTDKDGERRAKDKKDLYEKSQARLKNWPNTIQALRKKKDDDRIHRLEDEEIERRMVDAEEEQLNVESRQRAIEEANRQLHDNQDIVKAFHSKMMMADVIQEREAQDKLKGRKKDMERNIENQWLELEKQKMIEFDEQVKVKLEEEYKKKMNNAENIKNQHHDFKMNCIKRIQEEMLEGELIKKQVEDEILAEKKKDDARKDKQLKMRDDLFKSNEEMLKQKEEEKVKESAEEKKQEQFAKKKEQLDQLRKDKEEQKFREKQAEKQKMIERQVYELMMTRNQDVQRLNQQVAEAEDRANSLFEEQELRKIQMKEAIEKSRQQQIQKRKIENDSEKREAEEFSNYWKIRNDELEKAEQMEKEEEQERNHEMQRFLNMQMDQKQKKVEKEFMEEQVQSAKAQALLDQQEKQFYKYAENKIDNWKGQGKSVKPLVLELKGYKKRIQ